MHSIAEFVKTTLTGGLLVLFPLFACAYVIFRIAGALTSFIRPFLSFLPQNRLIGVAIADAASVILLLLLCFVTGVLIKTSVGSALTVRITRPLNRIPGYRMFSRVARIMFDQQDVSGTPVVVNRGQTKQIGFLMEEHSAEELTVFLPNAPSFFSGIIIIVKANKVERLNVPAAAVARMIATFGSGTSALLHDRELKRNDDDVSRPVSLADI